MRWVRRNELSDSTTAAQPIADKVERHPGDLPRPPGRIKAISPAPHCLCLRHGVPACRRCFCRGCGSHSDLRYLLPKAYKSAGKAFTAGQGDAQISP
jgi:hypothetical protein